MRHEEFLEKLPTMSPVKQASFGAAYVASDLSALKRCVRLRTHDKTPKAFVYFTEQLDDHVRRLSKYLSNEDATTALGLANLYAAKLGKHTENSFSEATARVGTLAN